MEDIKSGIIEVFNGYFNSIQEQYDISDTDLYKLKNKLLNTIDDIVVIKEKK